MDTFETEKEMGGIKKETERFERGGSLKRKPQETICERGGVLKIKDKPSTLREQF